MNDERSWDDDNRPSWRERDKMREGSQHRQEEKPAFAGSKQQQDWKRTKTKRALDKLFSAPKTPEQTKAEQRLTAAKGTPEFNKEAVAFFAEFGAGGDWRVQLMLAEATASAVAVAAIEALVAGAPQLGPPEQRNVITQLKMLAMTGKMKVKKAAKLGLEELE